jgi:hypothetical protein
MAEAMNSDQRWGELVELIEFVTRRLEQIGNGMEEEGIAADPRKYFEKGSEERANWHGGYLAALDDVLVFVERLHSRAAA